NTMNNFGEMQDTEKYTAQLISKINKGETVTVHSSFGKIGSRFYMHARNHADAILFLLNNVNPQKYNGSQQLPERYNVCGDEEIDNLELACIVADILDKELKYELVDYHTTNPGHDLRYGLDGSKLKA